MVEDAIDFEVVAPPPHEQVEDTKSTEGESKESPPLKQAKDTKAEPKNAPSPQKHAKDTKVKGVFTRELPPHEQ